MIRHKWIEKSEKGGYILKSELRRQKYRSNYLKYIYRAADIMNDNGIRRQVRKHERILFQAINESLRKEHGRII